MKMDKSTLITAFSCLTAVILHADDGLAWLHHSLERAGRVVGWEPAARRSLLDRALRDLAADDPAPAHRGLAILSASASRYAVARLTPLLDHPDLAVQDRAARALHALGTFPAARSALYPFLARRPTGLSVDVAV